MEEGNNSRELCSSTPDSGIDMSKFNIIDYVLTEGIDLPTDDLMVWDISTVNYNSSDQTSCDESTDAAAATKPWAEHAVSSTPVSKSVPQLQLRTFTRMEMERMKAIEETKREEEVQNKMQQARSQTQSTPLDLPLSTSPKVASIPPKLLCVQTRLENPTKFHLEQVVRNNIARYAMENNTGGGGSVPPAHTSPLPRLGPLNRVEVPGSAPPNIFTSTPRSPVGGVQNLHLDSGVPPSPGPTISSVATSVTSGCSESYEPYLSLDVDRDLSTISLSEINEIIAKDADEEALYNYRDVASLPPKTGGPRRNDDKTSLATGSPLISPKTPTYPEETVRAAKDRQKKDNHNKIERRRRFHINDMITIQGQLLPKPNEPYGKNRELYYEKFGDVKQNKGAILQASVEYTKLLKEDNEQLRMNEVKTQLRLQQNDQEIKKILLRVKALEQLCVSNGISIPEELITWKSPSPEALNNLIHGQTTIKEEPQSIQPSYCEQMEEDRSIVMGPCDPMLGQVDPDDIVLTSTIDSLEPQDFPDGMEFT